MTVRVRIAPSPTGNLHIGTARTAVFNWLFARHTGGTFILRVEDTDLERSKAEYTENIQSGLQWLGLNWDEGPFFQTQRLDHYRKAIQQLLDQGLAYRCYCTSEELEQMREAQKAKNQAPRYDNRHRNLTPDQEQALRAEGRQPVIRFRIDDDRQIVWQDQIRGQVVWQGSDLGGDMVIARASENPEEAFGQPLYNLAVVVDDIDMAITHVIRGEDHIANTAKQILLYEALGGAVPTFAHTPLILNQEGKKLSKRDGVTSIDDFRAMGFLPQAIANYMCLLGWTPPDSTQEIFTLAEAAEQFSLERVNKAGAKFDWQKLDWINSQYLHALPAAELVPLLIPHLEAGGHQVDPDRDQAWLVGLATLIGPSLTRLTDAATESQLLFGDRLELKEDGQKQLAVEGAKAVLEAALTFSQNTPELTLDEAKGEINRLTKELGLKKGVVMKSLRAGLMGTVQGPDLLQSWLLLQQKGWATTRLTQAIAAE
ncbi:glutamyl-tRNA synthetase [Synechocystis sp. PCC 6803]|uniref:Glutamate--tRNA ligase n=1 Tax=Synechocystis sp. (strain ATCC 27184 / PCC 6803 / Kazusa) TaxID=1111708 RepID=SYE_SYNY3|nr:MULTISPECIES: glutamate--tRNA ligase [unclassified Synechocystis]Q55778.1 RecName: Full=Glutamate--tRNA ligase; AltName: Full=Glutamyl-tRNA synthetase; Short=GluRS [Synechocystis sp. PCC 6803 substr. Kazusa]MBD2616765.1 glutamate--tRNA ligase [Synechocystis sp. FACHB-898]MBD2638079.1 glutamate--tRNA ligase [Synechocystis sp. FACHB-908]MBD2659483.1 glutamate--tRNA ligase [Synechocystis sp. FACHB-929]BAM53977.1 glutamyl-tRNA synthetase [Synechocystis sp. PCC 6803] [Bacillus subtilis BEST7613]